MTTFDGQDKPSLEYLVHHGVKGMKWGHRKKVTTSDIKDARQRLRKASNKYGSLEDKLSYGSESKTPAAKKRDAQIQKQLDKMDADFKNDPDRYVAARLTRGEKAVTVILGGPVGLAAIGAQSAVIRVGESRQRKRIAGK